MEETVKYLGCKIKGTSVTLKADFYLLCQCCQSQGRAKQCFGVDIVANPQKPNDMRPFDVLPSGNTIYDEVEKQQDANLTPAYLAYTAGCRNIMSPYEQCYRNHGNNLFILSTAWGIVRADFKIPKYDVSFSPRADPRVKAKLNSRGDYANNHWNSYANVAFNHLKFRDEIDSNLKVNSKKPIVVILARTYLLRFARVYSNSGMSNPLVIISYAVVPNNVRRILGNANVQYIRYATNANRTWHYEVMRII